MDRQKEIREKTSFMIKPGIAMNWQMAYERALDLVIARQPLVLAGPPGTGKTFMIDQIVKKLKEEEKLGKFLIVQFHRKFSYEDFIEGYAPSASGGFEKHDGVFKEFCKKPTTKDIDLFIIDEMNRAELSTTFGETLYAIEDREKRVVVTAHFNDRFSIPENLAILGTINTADRNIAIIDYALRRRFNFVYVFPDALELRKWLNPIGFGFKQFTVEDYAVLFAVINRRIRAHPLMGFNMQLGHSMFVPRVLSKPIRGEELSLNFEQVILPQLEAYCGFGNHNELANVLTPQIADKYLGQIVLTIDDIAHLVRAVEHERTSA